jgi:hypothetical protein
MRIIILGRKNLYHGFQPTCPGLFSCPLPLELELERRL